MYLTTVFSFDETSQNTIIKDSGNIQTKSPTSKICDDTKQVNGDAYLETK